MKPVNRSPRNFIEQIIMDDLKSGRIQQIRTRFPPEPNAYLGIGHAKSICLNFGLAKDFGGTCNLRFDDTNPAKEEEEYMESMKEDIRWLGFEWDQLCYASDYFEQFYQWALELIDKGLAYVDHQSVEEIRKNRGTASSKGTESPWRNRSIAENRTLFERMRAGSMGNGECVLRAKIDMSHPNTQMRDPILYRVLHQSHYRTGDRWCIYPMYDFAHGYEDAIEGITHSLCSLEFEDHRPLYDWLLDNVSVPSRPRQYEFARLNISFTVISKRLYLEMVKQGIVNGWDDPRMPTLRGLRRRGFTPTSIRRFCQEVGVAKADSIVDYEFLEYIIREELNKSAPRVMAVLNPLKVIIENYPEGMVEELPAENNPEDPTAGERKIPFSRELYIEADDFMEHPPKKYFRLSPGAEVRLKHAYYITCNEILRDTEGKIVELRCRYDPDSRGGGTLDGRKVRGTLHWVSANHALEAEVRLYDKLFTLRNMGEMEEGKGYKDYLNPQSLICLPNALIEPSLKNATVGDSFQFLRQGYFTADPDSTKEKLVFNRIVALKDSWKKQQ